MARLQPVGGAFVHDAPRVLEFTGEVSAPADAVFARIAGPASGWRDWFPGVVAGGNTTRAPFAEGAGRWVRVRGGGRFDETVIVYDAPNRWAFRVDATTFPIARALVEQWSLQATPSATRITWTFAIDPHPLFRIALPLAPAAMGRIFDRALRNLEQLAAVAGRR